MIIIIIIRHPAGATTCCAASMFFAPNWPWRRLQNVHGRSRQSGHVDGGLFLGQSLAGKGTLCQIFGIPDEGLFQDNSMNEGLKRFARGNFGIGRLH